MASRTMSCIDKPASFLKHIMRDSSSMSWLTKGLLDPEARGACRRFVHSSPFPSIVIITLTSRPVCVAQRYAAPLWSFCVSAIRGEEIYTE